MPAARCGSGAATETTAATEVEVADTEGELADCACFSRKRTMYSGITDSPRRCIAVSWYMFIVMLGLWGRKGTALVVSEICEQPCRLALPARKAAVHSQDFVDAILEKHLRTAHTDACTSLRNSFCARVAGHCCCAFRDTLVYFSYCSTAMTLGMARAVEKGEVAIVAGDVAMVRDVAVVVAPHPRVPLMRYL